MKNWQECKKVCTIYQNGYTALDKKEVKEDYCILFGNRYEGFAFNKEHLVTIWKIAINLANSMTGDISLHTKDKIIRSINNREKSILRKNERYRCTYTKYK